MWLVEQLGNFPIAPTWTFLNRYHPTCLPSENLIHPSSFTWINPVPHSEIFMSQQYLSLLLEKILEFWNFKIFLELSLVCFIFLEVDWYLNFFWDYIMSPPLWAWRRPLVKRMCHITKTQLEVLGISALDRWKSQPWTAVFTFPSRGQYSWSRLACSKAG